MVNKSYRLKSKAQAPLQISRNFLRKYRFVTGQASLEMAVALASVCIISACAMNVFVWLNKRLMFQQQVYELSRVAAGSTEDPIEIQVDESAYPKLNIFESTVKKASAEPSNANTAAPAPEPSAPAPPTITGNKDLDGLINRRKNIWDRFLGRK